MGVLSTKQTILAACMGGSVCFISSCWYHGAGAWSAWLASREALNVLMFQWSTTRLLNNLFLNKLMDLGLMSFRWWPLVLVDWSLLQKFARIHIHFSCDYFVCFYDIPLFSLSSILIILGPWRRSSYGTFFSPFTTLVALRCTRSSVRKFCFIYGPAACKQYSRWGLTYVVNRIRKLSCVRLLNDCRISRSADMALFAAF